MHRKVHLPGREADYFTPGDGFAAFDTPAGRLGMLICYDKVFPEAARSLALDGAEAIACLSAWPATRTVDASALTSDVWVSRFDMYDTVRAMETQVLWVSANQCGRLSALRRPVQGGGAGRRGARGHRRRPRDGPGDRAATGRAGRRQAEHFHLGDRRPQSYPPAPEVHPLPAGVVASGDLTGMVEAIA